MNEANIEGYVTLEYIAESVRSRMKTLGMENYRQVLQLVIDGVMELRMFSETNISVEYLTIGSDNCVSYPKDYLEYTKIGIEVGGQIYNLGFSPKMLPPKDQQCGVDLPMLYSIPGSSISNYQFPYAPHYRSGRYIQTMYGIGGGFAIAYYNDDRENRRFIIDRQVQGGEIVLEYRSTGLEPGKTVVPRTIVGFVRAYVIYTLSDMDNLPSTIVQRRKEDMLEQESMLRKIKAPTSQEFLDVIRSGFTRSPKR